MAAGAGPLDGVRVVSVAINLPGPAAVARLASLGASVTTVLPPGGDPLEQYAKAWFDELHAGQSVERLDLKAEADRARLDALLEDADVLVTSSRPSALARLGLDHATVGGRHTQVCQVDIVGSAGAGAEAAGHDLTYQAAAGLLHDGRMPSTTVVDLAGAERAVAEVCAALLERARTGRGSHRVVALADVADLLARPIVHGLTTPDGPIGGGLATYGVYAAASGSVALAALEPHFVARLAAALGVGPEDLTRQRLGEEFARRTAAEWQVWADEHDVPLVAVSSLSTPVG